MNRVRIGFLAALLGAASLPPAARAQEGDFPLAPSPSSGASASPAVPAAPAAQPGAPAGQAAAPSRAPSLLDDTEPANAFVSNVWTYRGLPLIAAVSSLGVGLLLQRRALRKDAETWPSTGGVLSLWLPPLVATLASFAAAFLVVFWQGTVSAGNARMIGNFSGLFYSNLLIFLFSTVAVFVAGGIAGKLAGREPA
jgi:hypothetical protein